MSEANDSPSLSFPVRPDLWQGAIPRTSQPTDGRLRPLVNMEQPQNNQPGLAFKPFSHRLIVCQQHKLRSNKVILSLKLQFARNNSCDIDDFLSLFKSIIALNLVPKMLYKSTEVSH